MNYRTYYLLALLFLGPLLLSAQIEIVQQTGHKAEVTALAVSPDGRYLATSEYYNPRVFLWDVSTRKKVLDFSVFSDMTDLAFSPDAQWIYGVTNYNRIFRYRINGQADTTYHYEANQPAWVTNNRHAKIDWGEQLLAFSQDKSIHTGNQEMQGMSFNKKEQVLKLESLYGEQKTLANPDSLHNQSAYMSLDFFADDRMLAAFRTSGLLEVWNVEKEQLQAAVPFPSINPFGHDLQLVASEQKSTIYLGCSDWEKIYTFNFITSQLDSLNITEATPSCFYFNEKAQQLLIGTTSSQLIIWDAQGEEILHQHQLPGKRKVTDITLLPGKEKEYYVSSGVEIFTYSSSYNLSLPFTRQLKLESPFDIDISSDGQLIMAYDTLVNILSLASGRTEHVLPHSDFIYFNRLSPDGKALYVATNKQLFKYSWPSLHRLWAIEHPLGRPRRIFFSPNNQLINLVAQNQAIQYLSRDGTEFIKIPGDHVSPEYAPLWIIGGTIDDQGNMIAVNPSSNDGVLQYWMKELNKPLNALSYDSHGPVRVYAATPDQRHVIFAYPEGWKAYTIDLNNSSNQLKELEGNTATAQYSNDHKLLATGSNGGKVKVFDVETLALLLEFEAGNARVYNLVFSKDDRYLFANMQDGHLYMYDLKERRPVAQILLKYENSLIITSQAYYMGTKSLLQSLGFKYNGQTFSFTQFDAQLNRPGKVMERLGFAQPGLIETYHLIEQKRSGLLNVSEDFLLQSESIPVARIKNRSAIPMVTKESILPLQLTYDQPTASDCRLQLWVNGVPIFGINGRPTAGETTLEVELNSGQNLIELALEKEGVVGRRTGLQVWCERESKPEAYVISIGVSDYQAEGKDLQFATKDAEDIAKLYQESANFDQVHTQTLLNEQVTKANILALRNWLERTTVDDQVVLYISGHGLLDENYDFYYATEDTDFANPAKKGILYDDIEGLLDGIPARRKLLLIDACHSGEYDKDAPPLPQAQQDSLKQKGVAFKGFSKGDEESAPVLGLQNSFELMQQLFADLRRGSGATVISSSSGVQVSYEDEEWQNGAFTYAFLYGLKSMKADENSDGQVTASEIQAFVAEYVPRLTDGLQVPTFRRENLEFDFRVW